MTNSLRAPLVQHRQYHTHALSASHGGKEPIHLVIPPIGELVLFGHTGGLMTFLPIACQESSTFSSVDEDLFFVVQRWREC